MSLIIEYLGSLGLILDIIGVSILFFVIITVGENVIRADPIEEIERKRIVKHKELKLKIGYVLLLFGFILQLISNIISLNKE